jgi:hypothetical protein
MATGIPMKPASVLATKPPSKVENWTLQRVPTEVSVPVRLVGVHETSL